MADTLPNTARRVGDPASARTSSQREALEARFLGQLPWVERVAASVCRRHGLSSDDADDFTSWVKLRLVEDDYAVFAKFRGESSITTYLAVVVAMLFRDYRAEHWGRWRPSAAARRQGPLAVRLETLVYRDRMPLAQAAQVLRTSGQTGLSDRELASLLAGLPPHSTGRPVQLGAEEGVDAAAPGRTDDFMALDEAESQRNAIDGVLRRLPAEDQVMLRMRFWEGLSVTDIARGLGIRQKPLYRRMDRALAQVRELLEQAGVSREQARAVLGE